MLNSCRLHWVPSTFSMMNICQGERWKHSIRQQILVQASCPAWKPTSWYCPSYSPAGTGSDPSLLSHCSWLAPNPSSSPLPFPCLPPPALSFPRRQETLSLSLRRCLCFSWSREGAGSRFPLLPWKASTGQDLSRGGCPCHPFPGSSQPPALCLTGITAQLSNKTPVRNKSPPHSIFSDFSLSKSFQFLFCCYNETNPSNSEKKKIKISPLSKLSQSPLVPPSTAHL